MEIISDLIPVILAGFFISPKPLMAERTDNLKPCKTTQEAQARGRLGGIASGKAKRKKKTMREALEILLALNIPGADGKEVETAEAVGAALVRRALSGDVKAYEVIRDTLGQKPAQKQDIRLTQTTPQKFVFEIVKNAGKKV